MTRKVMAVRTREGLLADAAARSVFTCVVALFSLHAALRMARDIFPAWAVPQKGLVWIQALAVFFILFYEVGIPALLEAVRQAGGGRAAALLWLVRYLCKLGAAAVFGWSCCRYAKSRQVDLEDGACAAAVQYLEKFNRHLHTSIQIWQGKEEWMGLALAFWTLAVFMGVLVTALALRRRILLLLFPLTVLALELLVGYIPQWESMALLFAALLFVQADGGGAKRADLAIHTDQRQRRGWRWYVYGIPAVCLAAAAAGLIYASSVLTDATQGWLMGQSKQVQEFQQHTEQRLTELWRGQFLQKTEGVNNKKPQYTRKEMLRVTASQCPSEDVLLKGFCGTDYREDGWVCETQAFADACMQAGYDRKAAASELLEAKYDLLLHGADRLAWYYTYGGGFVSIGTSEHKQAVYTVEHTGIRSQYAFVPYAVSDGGRAPGGYVGDATVQKRRGQNVFSYNGWRRFNGSVDITRTAAEIRKGVFQWYDRFVKTAYLATSDRVPTLDEYVEKHIKDQEKWDAIAGVFTSKKQSMQIRNWLTLLYLSQDMAAFEQDRERTDSGQEADAGDAAWCNANRMKIAQALSEALQRYQTYSLDLEPLAEGADPVWYFLMESRKGYCVHFASAAVLLLRELGVPARYASGYVARVSDFKQEGDVYVASVKDSSAHAWAEIYLDQIGWVPVDVTPADAGTFEQASSSTDQETETQDREQTQTDTGDTQTDIGDTQTDAGDTQTDTDDTRTDADDTQAAKEPDKTRRPDVWAALLAVTAFGLLWRAASVWQAAVEREIKAGKYGAAVRRVNRRIYRRMRFYRRISKQEIPDAQYEQALTQAWQQIPQEDWKRFMEIARKAAFAAEGKVSRQEAEFCLSIYQNLRKKVNC